jgi:hypothetical protein
MDTSRDFTASGRLRFERFFSESASPERRKEFSQALDECLVRLEDLLNAHHILVWALPVHYGRVGERPAVFIPLEVDLVIERATPDPEELARWAQVLQAAAPA